MRYSVEVLFALCFCYQGCIAMCNMMTSVFDDKAELARSACETIAHIAQETIASKGIFHVALSGGSMPSILSGLALNGSIDWSKWRIFFADERCVDLNHTESNYLECSNHIFSKINIPQENVFTISNVDDPSAAADAYESLLRSVIPPPHHLDLILLGLGPDGHTASLFPNHELLHYVGDRYVLPITDSPKPPPCRITLTLPYINTASAVIFIVTGASKASALQSIFSSYEDVEADKLPAAHVRPQGDMLWILDKEAAANIPKKFANGVCMR